MIYLTIIKVIDGSKLLIANDYENELCVWHEKELCESLLEQENGVTQLKLFGN